MFLTSKLRSGKQLSIEFSKYQLNLAQKTQKSNGINMMMSMTHLQRLFLKKINSKFGTLSSQLQRRSTITTGLVIKMSLTTRVTSLRSQSPDVELKRFHYKVQKVRLRLMSLVKISTLQDSTSSMVMEMMASRSGSR